VLVARGRDIPARIGSRDVVVVLVSGRNTVVVDRDMVVVEAVVPEHWGRSTVVVGRKHILANKRVVVVRVLQERLEAAAAEKLSGVRSLAPSCVGSV